MPLVKAIESGIRQTERSIERWIECGVRTFSNATETDGNYLERWAIEGDSPVPEGFLATRRSIQSTVRRNSRGNVGGTYI